MSEDNARYWAPSVRCNKVQHASLPLASTSPMTLVEYLLRCCYYYFYCCCYYYRSRSPNRYTALKFRKPSTSSIVTPPYSSRSNPSRSSNCRAWLARWRDVLHR
ncbi:hypothetical protein SAMN06295970_12922 [Noviherbaspirillum suwonense]|uniref:Uncharacterized protein n=1 Tax=Noviherbaspirillum suwonense TaxID=1224511 RepID=A0ABY1QS13_9BURK|nr:hypothetical protein SAMN06295970_12922 [Noviherbaspirillum suwonense]